MTAPLSVNELVALREIARAWGEASQMRADSAGGKLEVKRVKLSELSSSSWKDLNIRGYRVHFSKRASTAGALLELQNPDVDSFAPGDTLTARVEGGLQARLKLGSNTTGYAVLLVSRMPGTYLEEGDFAGGPSDPVSLLGSINADGTLTYVAVPEDTAPAGAPASLTGAFNCSGWRKIRVTIKGTALTTVDLIPWMYRGGLHPDGTGTNGEWVENGLEMISVPDSAPTAYSTRSFILNVSGNGWMFFQPRNLAPGALTALNMIVEGIE